MVWCGNFTRIGLLVRYLNSDIISVKVNLKIVSSATLVSQEQRIGDTAQFTTILCNATRQGRKLRSKALQATNKGSAVLLLELQDWCTPPHLQDHTASPPAASGRV
jgi:hypothetical protein